VGRICATKYQSSRCRTPYPACLIRSISSEAVSDAPLSDLIELRKMIHSRVDAYADAGAGAGAGGEHVRLIYKHLTLLSLTCIAVVPGRRVICCHSSTKSVKMM
jgi:hypothetical protein